MSGSRYEEIGGMELKEAIAEANRCLHCRNPQCQKGCPIANDIPEFIEALAQGNLGEARRVIARKSNLPAICGRVCAHEQQCEGHCILEKTGAPIKVGMLEKTIADFGFEMNLPLEKVPQKTKGKIAVIGSGPAGLTIAGDLAKQGFSVSVFEALGEPGGVLLYGIPPFRLPKDVVRRETQNIKMLGVTFHTGCVVGEDITVDTLFADGFDAIFIGTGTAVSKDLKLPGREFPEIIQSSYFLRMNYLYRSGQLQREEVPVEEGDRVLVIGAGNVGMDAARTALQLGAKSVKVISNTKEDEITALPSEYEAAKSENVEFLFEHESIEFIGSNGKLESLLLMTPNGTREIPAEKIFLAVGSRPANRIVSTTKGIGVDSGGYVAIRERPYGMTTLRGVFAGGDVVHRPATVVLAMKEAKRVAESMAEYVNAIDLLRTIDGN